MEPHTYSVSRAKKAPLVKFILDALTRCGCRVLHEPDPGVAPYRFTFLTPDGERLGIMVYAFFANSKATRNRPDDEHRFQVKYSSKTDGLHELWQDPHLLYTTLFCGIDPNRGIFFSLDPIRNDWPNLPPTIEYDQSLGTEILNAEWMAWEYEPKDAPIEVVIGGAAKNFFRLIRFEQEALREDPGVRHLLADRIAQKISV